MRQIRTTIGATTIDPALLIAAERIQYEGYLRREETNAAILELSRSGATIKEIVRSTGFSRGLVRKVFRGQRTDVFRVRESSLGTYLRGSTNNGRRASITACGGGSNSRGFADAFGWSANGLRAAGEPTRLTPEL
jgi:hypothetical protein